MLLDKVRTERGGHKRPLTYVMAGGGEFGRSAHVVIVLQERRKRRERGAGEKRRAGEEEDNITFQGSLLYTNVDTCFV